MECCSICLGQLEETKNLCNDCIRSKQEKHKELIREKKTVLQLLKHESKSLKKRIKAEVQSTHDLWESSSTTNLAAANMHAMRETTQKYAEEVVKKEEQEIADLRANIAQRHESILKTRAFISIMQKHLEEVRQKNQQPPSSNSNISTSSIKPTTNTTTSTSNKTTTSTTTSSKTGAPITSPSSSSKTIASPSSTTVSSTSTSSKNIASSVTTSTRATFTSTTPTLSPSVTPSSSPSVHSKPHTSRKSSSTSLLSSATDPKSSSISKPSSHHRSSSTSSSSSSSHHHTSSRHRSGSSSHHHKSSLPPPIYTHTDLQNARQKLAHRRRALVSELLSFFPINPSPTSSETETIILNVTMPNNGVYHYYRPDALSAALGYVAHAVYILAGYLGVPLPWQIEFAGARSAIWDPFNGKRHPLFGTRYADIEPGLAFLNRDIVYLCGSQGVHIPLSAHRCTLPNLLALLRCPTLGMPGPLEALRPEPVVRYSRPPLRVKEPPSPEAKRDLPTKEGQSPKVEGQLPKTEGQLPKVEGQLLKTEEDIDDESDFIVVEHSSIPTPEQTEELEHFERAMFIDTTT